MLRTIRDNNSIHYIVLIALCLCSSLMLCLFLPPAHAAKRREQPYCVVDSYKTPGAAYRIVNREPHVFFERRLGSISSIALYNGRLYFCSINDKRIYLREGQQERVVFEHGTYVRDISVDLNGNLYFSQASGANGDGKIYKLSPPVDELGSKQQFSISKEERPIWIYLKTVDGFWSGDFTFDSQGNLYLSTGNRIPGFIYKVQREENGKYGFPRKSYQDTKGVIKGIAIDPSNLHFVYYVDWDRTIYKLDISNLRRSVEFSGNISRSRDPHLSDVAFDVGIRRKK